MKHAHTFQHPAAAILVAVALLPFTSALPIPPNIPPLDPDDPLALLSCLKLGTYRAIWEIQGEGERSPYEDEVLAEVRGVVTANFQRGTGGPYEPWGFYFQAHEGDCDPATSDGVFVYTGSGPRNVKAGDLISIENARVVEYQGPPTFVWEKTLTELVCLGGCIIERLEEGHALPDPLEYAPPSDPAEAALYGEAREGMLVQVSENATAITPADAYDEVTIVRGALQDRRHAEGAPSGDRIIIDGDGVAAAKCGQNGLGYIRTFDQILFDPASGSGALGPLTYGFNTYRIQQDDDRRCLLFTQGDHASWDPYLDPAPTRNADSVTLGSINVENFFDTIDDPLKNDTLVSTSSFHAKSRKIAAAICDAAGLAAPDVVALQEVENAVVLTRLVSDVSTKCGAIYEAHTRNAPYDRGIENSYLVRADRVEIVTLSPRQGCGTTNYGLTYEEGDDGSDVVCPVDTPHFLHERPPLELVARVHLAAGPVTVDLFNVHFKSKLTSSLCTEADCTDWRIAQSQHLRSVVAARLAADPSAKLVVLGDINDHYGAEPLQILAGPGAPLSNAWSEKQGPPSTGQGSIQRYSYIYQGLAQTLDHTLLSPALRDGAHVFSPRHINVDWPGTHESDASMLRVSDHDPIVLSVG